MSSNSLRKWSAPLQAQLGAQLWIANAHVTMCRAEREAASQGFGQSTAGSSRPVCQTCAPLPSTWRAVPGLDTGHFQPQHPPSVTHATMEGEACHWCGGWRRWWVTRFYSAWLWESGQRAASTFIPLFKDLLRFQAADWCEVYSLWVLLCNVVFILTYSRRVCSDVLLQPKSPDAT